MPETPRSLPRLSVRAQEIMNELITQQGLSYADAIRRANRMAREASRPYLQVAEYLRATLDEMEKAGA